MKIWKDIEKIVGDMRFAVVLIAIYAVVLVIGTFAESYHGAEFANRFIYKSLPFFGLQFLLFLSIFVAALVRLPPKKRLYGFYTVHAGLLTMTCGAYLTWFAGIDGTVTLPLNSPERSIRLSEDLFVVEYLDQGKKFEYPLPFKAFKTQINKKINNINLKTYLPFSQNQLRWVPIKNDYYRQRQNLYQSGQYLLMNDFVTQELTLSNHPEALEFDPSTQMGPLSVHMLPSVLASCFELNPKEGLIFYNERQGTCELPSSMQLKQVNPQTITVRNQGVTYRFRPQESPWPLDSKGGPIQGSFLKVFNLNLFQEKPHLFLFGDRAAYYDESVWKVGPLKKSGWLNLPWMNLRIQLVDFRKDQVPDFLPVYQRPIQDRGQVLGADQKAALVEVESAQQVRRYWVKSFKPLIVWNEGERIKLSLRKKFLKLPFELSLDQFKMDTDPGTRNPASYESFVNLFSDQGQQRHHIYMNNPLKKSRFTFYQASYFKDEGGNYGSVLSVNFDPGRWTKYLGALLIVLGSIWHFALKRKKKS